MNPFRWFARKLGYVPKAEHYSKAEVDGLQRKFQLTSAGAIGKPRQPLRASVTDLNLQIIQDRDLALGRAETAYYNNGLYRGAVRGRRARTIADELRCRAALRPDALGLTPAEARKIGRALTTRYRLWADSGEADSTGMRRPLGALQGEAFIGADVQAGALVHVVHRPQNKHCPIAVEVISGRRMHRPYNTEASRIDQQLINDVGIQYTDLRHREVAGYWVMVRSGNSELTGEFEFLPAKYTAFLRPEQLPGVETGFPRDTAAVRPLSNLSQLNDEILQQVRSQAKTPITITVGANTNPADIASAMATGVEATQDTQRQYLVNDIDGITTEVLPKDCTATRHVVNGPANDYVGFQQVQLESVAAATDQSYSRVSKRAAASYSAGRQEEQQDEPQLRIDRSTFATVVAGLVWECFVEACWAFDLIDLPNYEALREHYCIFMWSQPKKEALNPVQEETAKRSKREAGRSSETEQAEEEGDDYIDELLPQQAEDWLARRATEDANAMPEFSLEPRTQTGQLFSDVSIKEQSIDAEDASGGEPPAKDGPALKLPALNGNGRL